MSASRGQALVEYVVILTVLIAALCLPLTAGESLVQQLESAIRHFWQAWRVALFTAEYCA